MNYNRYRRKNKRIHILNFDENSKIVKYKKMSEKALNLNHKKSIKSIRDKDITLNELSILN